MNIKYQDISDAMREKIRSGVWGPGQRLPIRSELVKQYNTTVATLQKAMDCQPTVLSYRQENGGRSLRMSHRI